MTRTTVTRRIAAPIEKVFETVAYIGNFSKVIPHIVRVDILSDVQRGVGTRFAETRNMNGKEVTVELEVTELVENEHVRIVSDAHGTVWDTVFEVRPVEGQVELTMTMDARAYKLLPKLMNPLVKGMIRKAIENDMDAVKAHCEGASGE